MAYWLFMLVMDLILPLSMLGLGRYFRKKAPAKINYAFGYRTNMSMKNQDTWAFAHHHFGKTWFLCGLVLLPLSVVPMLCVLGKGEHAVSLVGSIVCGVQLIPLLGSIIPTERALRRTFDRDGNRRV